MASSFGPARASCALPGPDARGGRCSRLSLLARRLLLLTLLAVPGPRASAEADAPAFSAGDGPSIIAPLASRALVLDLTVAGSRVVAVGERGHVLLSDDEGQSWRQVPCPTSASLTAVWFADERRGWIVGHDAVILHSEDGGESWALQYRDIDLESPLLDVWFENAEHGIAVGAYGLFLETMDSGAHWVRRSISDSDAHYNSIVAASGGRLYLLGEFGTVLVSEDAGASWSAIESPYQASFFGGLGLPDGRLLVFGLRGNAFRFDPEQGSWESLKTGTQSSLMGASLTPDGRLLIGGADGAMLSGDPSAPSLSATRRRDRGSVSALAVSKTGRVLVAGSFGVDVLADGAAAAAGR